MSDDARRPGEIDLEPDGGEPGAAAETSAAGDAGAADAGAAGPDATGTDADTGTVEAGDQADAGESGAAAGDTGPKPRGAVKELIELRKENRLLRERQQALDTNPVIQRLTPEIQQAILEGRVHIQPPASTREAERDRLTSVAQELGLFKVTPDGRFSGEPDLEAAKKVDAVIRRTVDEAVTPERHARLSEKAVANYHSAIAFAQEHGFDVETVREVFEEVAGQPNGAQLLAQRKVCERIWETAVGRMHTRGKATGTPGAKRDKPPAAVITEPTGARGGGGRAVTLSPGLQRIYRDHGVDPAKSFSSTRPLTPGQPIDLE